jgi:hypothetical protein
MISINEHCSTGEQRQDDGRIFDDLIVVNVYHSKMPKLLEAKHPTKTL